MKRFTCLAVVFVVTYHVVFRFLTEQEAYQQKARTTSLELR